MSSRVALLVSMMLGAGCVAGEAGNGAAAGDSEAADALRQCSGGALVPGVDVSYYENTIDWPTVGDVDRGKQMFAFVRAGDGYHTDTKFDVNWQGAADAGLYRGAYWFFRASEDPIRQAEGLLDAIDWQIGPQDLPPVIDLEVQDGVSAKTVASRAIEFVEYVYGILGRKPLVYTGSGFEAEIGDPSTLGQYPLWIANWTSACPAMPHRWSSWRFWQHKIGSYGAIDGIRSKTDLNYFNGSAEDLAAYAGPDGAD